jgi:AcrR family transcriptional regulator
MVFAEQGFHQATISQIARAAGVADGTIYLYFKNKDDIMANFFDSKTRQVFAHFREVVDQAVGAEEKLRSLIQHHLEEFQRDRFMAVVYQAETRRMSRMCESQIREMSKLYHDLVSEIIEQGQQEGMIRKDLYVGLVKRFIIGAVDEVINTWLHSEGAPWNGVGPLAMTEGDGWPKTRIGAGRGCPNRWPWLPATTSWAPICLHDVPGLTHGAGKLVEAFGTEEQKKLFLKKMYTGKWGGTMLLTEPEAGSDVGALTTTAVKNDDGTYSITGSKIFISGGEHDLAENIIHPVLARIEGAPAGTKGISLFLVPKIWVNDDGSLGEFNDVVCTGIEERWASTATPPAP